MKPGNFLALCGVALAIATLQIADATLQLAFMNDYNAYKFYLMYDTGTAPTSIEYKITVSSGNLTNFVSLSSNTNDPNYFTCGGTSATNVFKICTAVIGDLADWRFQQLPDVSVVFSETGSTNEFQADYFGRNMEFVPLDSGATRQVNTGTYPSWTGLSPTFGLTGSLDFNDIGYDTIPTTYQPSSSNGQLVQVTINYEGVVGTISAGTSTVGNQGSLANLNNPSSITLFYGSQGGQLCGLQFNTEASIGCSTVSERYSISSGYQFAGFISLRSGVNYLLVPIQYQLLKASVAYYRNKDSSSSDFFFKIHWRATSITVTYEILDARDNAGDPAYTTYFLSGTFANTDVVVEIDLLSDDGQGNSMNRACTNILINDMDTNAESIQSNREYSTTSSFSAWTSGYTESDLESWTSPGLTRNVNDDVFTTALPVAMSAANFNGGGQCTFDFLETLELGFSSNLLYVNGAWLGPDQGAAPSLTDLSTRTNSITAVVVYYDAQGVVGFVFSLGGGNTATLGTTSTAGGVLTQTIQPTGGVQGYVSYMDVVIQNSRIIGVDVSFQQPALPWNVWCSDIPDDTGSFYDDLFTASEEDDGDKQEIRFWMPYDSSSSNSVTLSISGFLGLSFDDSTTLTLSGASSTFSRAMSYSAVVYFLVAQTDYSFGLGGTSSEILPSGASVMPVAEPYSFDTPNGARLRCQTNGLMIYQIEYEAVPDVQTYQLSVSEPLSNPPNSAMTASSSNTNDLYPTDSSTQRVFHYSSGNQFPIVNEFRGYPIGIEVYHMGNGYIEGFKVIYQAEISTEEIEFELAGSQAQDSGLGGYSMTSVDLQTLDSTITGFNYAASNGRLSGIQFLDENDNTVGGCLGPAISCSLVGPRQADLTTSFGTNAEYFISGFTLTLDSQNDGIYGISATYTYVDMPTLLNSDRICELTPHYDLYYLRNTAWTFQLNLDPNNGVCGTQQSIDNDGDPDDIPTDREDELPPFFDHAKVYWQVVTRQRDDGAGGGVGGTFNGSNGAVISRAGSAWEASAFCYYNASDIVSSEFSVTAEPGISASGKNEFTYKMEVARSSDFSSFYTGNEVPTTILNSDLNVRVTFQDDTLVNGYTVVTSDCWATQTSDPDDPTRFALETDFCPDTDSTFQRVASPSVDMEYFQFMAFGWYLNGAVTTNTVYLHCTVLACPPEDTTACDLPTCTTKRQRRALGALANHQSAALRSEQEAKLVTSPPIVVMRRDVEELQIARSPINNNYSPFTTALACVFTVGAMLSLIVVGGLFFCRRNKIQANYQRLSSGPSDNFGI